MSRGNDGLPMLPPWLSESEVSQSGYEAPVQNLPHDELIEESPSRRRGRFKNRSPEAERPDAARPEKRRKGWRRDKHEGPADDDRSLSEAGRAPGPDVPAPGQRPPDAWGQQPGHDPAPPARESTPPAQDNSWEAPPQRNALPQSSLPTRNPSQPSPGFQPLGSRAGEQPGAQQAPAQHRRPDLPPPPPLPDPPRQAVEERPAPAPHDEPARSAHSESGPGQATGTGRPPFAPQPGGWPSTGNPRLDAALSAVRPSQWPGTLPPGQQTPPPSSGQPVAPPTSPNPGWPAGADPAAPTVGDSPAQPPHGGQPTAPVPGTDQAARQSAGSSAPAAAPPAGADPAARTSAAPSAATGPAHAAGQGSDLSTGTGSTPTGEHSGIPTDDRTRHDPTASSSESPAVGSDGAVRQAGSHQAAPTASAGVESGQRPTPGATGTTPSTEAQPTDAGPAPQAGGRPAVGQPWTAAFDPDELSAGSDAGSVAPPAGDAPAPGRHDQPATPTDPAAGSEGPPPWLAGPRPEDAQASAPGAPRRLPPLPDPPAPHERPDKGETGTQPPSPAHDERRLSPHGADGPPPWLGHTAPEQAGRPSAPGLPPAPKATAAPGVQTPTDPAPEQRTTSNAWPTDSGATGTPAAAPTPGPHAGQSGVGPVPPVPGNALAAGGPAVRPTEATGQPSAAAQADSLRSQQDPGAAASGWTAAAVAGGAAARPIGGRHRLPAEPNSPVAPPASAAQAPDFDQVPVPQQRPAPAHNEPNSPLGPYAPSGEHAGYPPQFAAGQVPGSGTQAPADQWATTGHPGTAAIGPDGRPAQFPGGPAPVEQPADQWRSAAERNSAPESGQAAPHSAPPVPPQHPEPQNYAQPGGQQWGTPPGYAQPQAQQPGGQFQPSLDNVPMRRAKRAPGSGWRKAVHHVSGGAINPGMSAEERRLQELVARIRQPVRGDYRIAVLSLKGGVGKTTTTMGIGSIFASIRGDRVIAVDANPDFGTLSQRVPLQTRSTVRDLLLDSSIQRYSDVRRHTSQATSRLEVLASERDPAASEAFSEEEYRAVARILQRFYNIILTDCGTGLMHSAMSGVLDLAHSLVLISSPAIDGARSAAATLDWLSLHGHDHLVRNAVVVINSPRAGSPNVGIQQLREYFLSRCRAVHIIPFDVHMSEGAEIDLHRLHKQTKRAYVELAATVADDFATDHRRYRP
ncbi:MinD/ParA family ATP-binding protein [Nocardia abscessus]|uniref:MinD/ParA family ATP-binding protein n=2 Tax=Nocardia abscessus TaxID=120957 RepID=UPI001D138A56|nr:MinD/ParA family protein [Nocardia abscessus]MCC3326938.1 AAA family ATPase [Nocardia abscessus]